MKGRKKMLCVGAFACAFGLGWTASADHLASVDSDGCWDGATTVGGPCIQLVEGRFVDREYRAVFENQCLHRVYAKLCLQKNDGGWVCGAEGIRGQARYTFSWWDVNGQGRASAVGSDNPDKDWVCAGRYKMHDWKP